MNIEQTIQKFKSLLDEKKEEQIYQDFLEQHSELIPTNLLILNHGVHFDFVISKLSISQNYKTDFCYLTKSSQEWYIVLIEIEKPSKRIFKRNGNDFEFSSDFNSALNQINNWKIELENNKSVVDSLDPLVSFNQIMRNNPITFKYMLIYGRSAELDTTIKKQKFIQAQKQHDIMIKTYDSLISNLQNPQEEWLQSYHNNPDIGIEHIRSKNILTKRINGFKMKYLNSMSKNWLEHLSPEQLDLTEDQKQKLRDDGFLVDKWIEGKELCNGGRCLMRDIFRRNCND